MPLQKQIAELPIVGGIDEKTAPKLCVRMRSQTNCRQVKSGALAKRYGTNCAAANNAFLGGGIPQTAELLTVRGNELVRIGNGELCVQQTVASTDWVRKTHVSEVLIYRDGVPTGEAGLYDTDVGYVGGFAIFAYSVISGIRCDVINVTTGAKVYTAYVVDATAATLHGPPKVCIIGTKAIIVYQRDTVVRARVLETSTMTWGAATALPGATGLNASLLTGIDACSIPSNSTFAVAWTTTAGPPYSHIRTYTGVLAAAHATVDFTTYSGVFCHSLCAGATYLWYANSSTNGVNSSTDFYVLDPVTLATVSGPTVLVAATYWSMGICEIDATHCLIAVDDLSSIRWNTYSSAGAAGTPHDMLKMAALSRPFRDATTGHVYLLVMNDHVTHGTIFLVQLQHDFDTTYALQEARIVGTSAVRQVPPIKSDSASRYRTASSLSSAALASAGRYYLAAHANGAQSSEIVGALLDVRIGSTKPNAAWVGGMLFVSGGTPTVYAGGPAVEYGMPYEPDTSTAAGLATIAAIAGAGLQANARYRYLLVYEWVLDDGSVMRSPPSDPLNPLTVNTTAANASIRLRAPYLAISNKEDEVSLARMVSIVPYRTLADGGTYYRLPKQFVPTQFINNPNAGSAVTATYDDTTTDAELSTHPTLYTTGAALVDEIPPSAAHVALIDGRVWLSGTDDDTIWFSDSLVVGEAPRFSGSRTIAPFEGGRVVAMAKLDDKKVIFKADAIYFVIGEGPNTNLSDGTFTNPTLVQSDVGCIEPRSIVSTPAGLMFQSRSGIYLLGRDLSVSPIGKPIEDTLASYSVCAAVLVPDLNVVRFALEGTNIVLEYDLFHGGVWSKHTYKDGTGTSPAILAMAYHQGAWKFVNADGRLYAETKTSWLDVRGGSSAWVPMSARTMPFRLDALQGSMRVWYASLLCDKRSGHDATVTVYSEDDTDLSSSRSFTWAEIDAMPREQLRVHIANQQCESVAIEFSDATPTSGGIGTGEAFALSSIAIEFGIQGGLRKVPASQKK